MALKVCIVTGTRAEWGLLRLPAQHIKQATGLELQIVATAAHLVDELGHTVDDIEKDGFTVDARIPTLEPGDDVFAITRSLGRGVIGFAQAFEDLQPDIVMVLGDRYEMLGVVQAALLARIPVAHLCGGDITEGAFDESIRHAITKMSHIHFVTNRDAEKRVRQMGEDPRHIHLVGSPGIDAILQQPRLPKAELFADLGLTPREKTMTVTFHPPTLDERSAQEQMQILLDALQDLEDDVAIILTGSNADIDGLSLTRMAEQFAKEHDNAAFRISLGQQNYYSALAISDVAVGNSSSGLYEAPSFNIPTVNIGDRQKGRLRATSTIDCETDREEIVAAINKALEMDCTGTVNPYGDGEASPRIVTVLQAIKMPRSLITKHFFDLDTREF